MNARSTMPIAILSVPARVKQAVWKYHLHSPVTQLEMPLFATVLSVGAVGGEAYLWALVDPVTPRRETRTIHCVNTGVNFEFARDAQYYGTVLLNGGVFVTHVFEAVRAGLSWAERAASEAGG